MTRRNAADYPPSWDVMTDEDGQHAVVEVPDPSDTERGGYTDEELEAFGRDLWEEDSWRAKFGTSYGHRREPRTRRTTCKPGWGWQRIAGPFRTSRAAFRHARRVREATAGGSGHVKGQAFRSRKRYGVLQVRHKNPRRKIHFDWYVCDAPYDGKGVRSRTPKQIQRGDKPKPTKKRKARRNPTTPTWRTEDFRTRRDGDWETDSPDPRVKKLRILDGPDVLEAEPIGGGVYLVPGDETGWGAIRVYFGAAARKNPRRAPGSRAWYSIPGLQKKLRDVFVREVAKKMPGTYDTRAADKTAARAVTKALDMMARYPAQFAFLGGIEWPSYVEGWARQARAEWKDADARRRAAFLRRLLDDMAGPPPQWLRELRDMRGGRDSARRRNPAAKRRPAWLKTWKATTRADADSACDYCGGPVGRSGYTDTRTDGVYCSAYCALRDDATTAGSSRSNPAKLLLRNPSGVPKRGAGGLPPKLLARIKRGGKVKLTPALVEELKADPKFRAAWRAIRGFHEGDSPALELVEIPGVAKLDSPYVWVLGNQIATEYLPTNPAATKRAPGPPYRHAYKSGRQYAVATADGAGPFVAKRIGSKLRVTSRGIED